MVASVGIAATVFLFTLKPALASLASIPSGIPSTCQSSCQALLTDFSNNKCVATGVLRCLCTSAVADGLKVCLECFVSMGTIEESDVTGIINNLTTKCAQGGIQIYKNSASSSSSLSSASSSLSSASSSFSNASSSLAISILSSGSSTVSSLAVSSLSASSLNTSSSSNTLPANTGITFPIFNAASKMCISTFGVMITTVTVLGTILSY